jgi:hypothetical protein
MSLKDFDYDKVWIGIILGSVTPPLLYFIYFSLANKFHLKTVNVSLCMVAELFPFYLTLNRELYKATKGVLIATVALAALVGYLSFFTNFFHVI